MCRTDRGSQPLLSPSWASEVQKRLEDFGGETPRNRRRFPIRLPPILRATVRLSGTGHCPPATNNISDSGPSPAFAIRPVSTSAIDIVVGHGLIRHHATFYLHHHPRGLKGAANAVQAREEATRSWLFGTTPGRPGPGPIHLHHRRRSPHFPAPITYVADSPSSNVGLFGLEPTSRPARPCNFHNQPLLWRFDASNLPQDHGWPPYPIPFRTSMRMH